MKFGARVKIAFRMGYRRISADLKQHALPYKLRWHMEWNEARALWMEEVQLHFLASQFVWTDESSKDDCMIYHHYAALHWDSR